jgi:hypothetical protein
MLQTTSIYRNAIRARRGFSNLTADDFQVFADLQLAANLSAEIAHAAWFRMTRYPQGDLHQQLLEGDPNDEDNEARVVDLLGLYGRLDDAMRFGMRCKSMSASFEWLGFITKPGSSAPDEMRVLPSVIDLRNLTEFEVLSPLDGELPAYWKRDWPIVALREQGLLVHPVGRLTTVAMIAALIEEGAVKVTVRWVHLRPDGEAAEVSIGVGDDCQSEWRRIAHEDGVVDIILDIPRAQSPRDLYLKTRATGNDSYVWPIAKFVRKRWPQATSTACVLT